MLAQEIINSVDDAREESEYDSWKRWIALSEWIQGLYPVFLCGPQS